jgi:ADP-heptose:LPS heptosyltransferase
VSPPQEFRSAPPAVRFLAALARPARAERDAAQRRLASGEATRILVLKPHDQLGDFLVATPALAALRARFPKARITLVTRAYLAPLARRQPAVDEVLALRSFDHLVRAWGMLRTPRPDAAFVLNSVSRSRTADLAATASGAALIVGRSRVGAGALTPAAARHDDPVYDLDVDIAPGSVHQVDRVLDLVRWTGATAAPHMTLALAADERARAAAAFGAFARGARIGIHPAAANALKCWPLGSFIELASRLAARGHTPIVFDSPKEPGPARALLDALLSYGVEAHFVPAGALEEFIPLASGLDLMVCNDSGVMHIAAALGVPTLSLHSLGRPEEWAPRNDAAIGLHAEPIAGITVDDAERAALRLLERAPSSRG